jgi:integrase/recombinase XerD
MRINQARIDFLKGYFSTHERSKKTRAAYLCDITQFQEFVGNELSLLLLNGNHIERWAAKLREKGYSPASIRRKIVVLKVFCSYWVRNGAMKESPFWRVKISYGRIEQLPRALTEIEMKSILRQAKLDHSTLSHSNRKKNLYRPTAFAREFRNLRNLAVLELLFATGMRVGEVSSIDIKDFHAEEALFKIKGKGGRERLAFVVDKVTLQVLKEYLKARMEIETESAALFLNAAGNRLSTQGIARIITQLREDGGVKRNVTPHMLRHTVATLLLRNGVDIRVVQEFLGHSSIATTQRYIHIVKEHMIRELRNHHPSIKIREGIYRSND